MPRGVLVLAPLMFVALLSGADAAEACDAGGSDVETLLASNPMARPIGS